MVFQKQLFIFTILSFVNYILSQDFIDSTNETCYLTGVPKGDVRN